MKWTINDIHQPGVSLAHRRAWVLAALIAHLAGCATSRSEDQLRSLNKQVVGLRAEIVNCRRAIEELTEEQKTLASKLIATQRDTVQNIMDKMMASAGKALRMFDDKPKHPLPARIKKPTRRRVDSVKVKNFNASKWVKRVGKNRYNIKGRGLKIVFSNTTILARSARIVPSVRNGKPSGFRLYAIRPGSFYYVLGLRNGDAVEQINGMSITTPDKALEVYTRIRNARVVTASVRRKNALLDFIYTVVP